MQSSTLSAFLRTRAGFSAPTTDSSPPSRSPSPRSSRSRWPRCVRWSSLLVLSVAQRLMSYVVSSSASAARRYPKVRLVPQAGVRPPRRRWYLCVPGRWYPTHVAVRGPHLGSVHEQVRPVVFSQPQSVYRSLADPRSIRPLSSSGTFSPERTRRSPFTG